MSEQPPPAPSASAVGPCSTVIQIVGHPDLEVYPGPSHHPTTPLIQEGQLSGTGESMCTKYWLTALEV